MQQMQRNRGATPSLIVLFLSSALFLTSCGAKNPLISEKTFEFSFPSIDHDWQGEFVDLPVNAGDIYEMVYEPLKQLPDEVGPGYAPFLQSHNRSDDVFMFIKKQVSGLSPNTNYVVRFEVSLATNVPANSVGAGGSPGESIYVKAGVSTIEPKGIVETVGGEDYYRLNVDKGNQSTSGSNALVIGNLAKTPDDLSDRYQKKVLTNGDRMLMARTDASGNAWIFVGTDSAFEGLTRLYYTKILVSFE